MARTRSRPPAYAAMSFHAIHAIAFVCQAIVAGILIYFVLQLRSDGFRIPWVILIDLVSSLLAIITIVLTALFYMCSYLSPLFSVVLNSTVFFLQIVGFGMITDNLRGMLGRSCSASNWANADGRHVCNTYKAFYAFSVFALLAQVALIIYDIRARRNQTKLGTYGNIDGSRDIKLDKLDRNSIASSRLGVTDTSYTGGSGHSHQASHASSVDGVPYGIQDYSDQPTRPTAYQPQSYQQQSQSQQHYQSDYPRQEYQYSGATEYNAYGSQHDGYGAQQGYGPQYGYGSR